MLYGRYTFSSLFQDDAVLPEYKGSTFRGVFGHALKQVACALKRQDCADCLLRERCIYSLVFELPAAGNAEGRKRIAAPPHPYVIEPPEEVKSNYKKGESFNFSILLFGKANDYLPYFIYAFEQMGKLGIGRRVNGKRSTFSLKTVSAFDEPVYSAAEGKVRNGTFTRTLSWDNLLSEGRGPIHALDIALRTPLRIKHENRLEASLPFHVLIRAMLRRISSLQQYHGNGEPALDYRGLVARAETVVIKESSIRWFDWKRFSNRQEQSMLMGGMVGRVSYAGKLDEFIPLIRYCEEAHIGKQTSFGLGKIELTRTA